MLTLGPSAVIAGSVIVPQESATATNLSTVTLVNGISAGMIATAWAYVCHKEFLPTKLGMYTRILGMPRSYGVASVTSDIGAQTVACGSVPLSMTL